MTESEFQARVIKTLRGQYCKVIKFNEQYNIGIPDLMIWSPNHQAGLWMELKVIKLPKMDKTPIKFGISGPQKTWLREWHGCPHRSMVLVGCLYEGKVGWFIIRTASEDIKVPGLDIEITREEFISKLNFEKVSIDKLL